MRALFFTFRPDVTSRVAALALASSALLLTGAAAPEKDLSDSRYRLVEDFTAATLDLHELKIGTDLDFGVLRGVMLGSDTVGMIVGTPSLRLKAKVFERGSHEVSLGLRAAYLTRKTLLWGSAKDHFEKLEAKVLRPSVSWSNKISPRLTLHNYWAVAVGRVNATLSESGKRSLWEKKHPGGDFDSKTTAPAEPTPQSSSEAATPSTNQEKEASAKSSSNFAQRTLPVQTITGNLADTYQITGEFTRQGGNKVLLTSRIERITVEELKSLAFRLTAAQHWIWPNFQIRLGFGLQYVAVTGRDLDGEPLDEDGILPASDIVFYWRI